VPFKQVEMTGIGTGEKIMLFPGAEWYRWLLCATCRPGRERVRPEQDVRGRAVRVAGDVPQRLVETCDGAAGNCPPGKSRPLVT
jgi:hypothetical protein